jgi:hypothetical protein
MVLRGWGIVSRNDMAWKKLWLSENFRETRTRMTRIDGFTRKNLKNSVKIRFFRVIRVQKGFNHANNFSGHLYKVAGTVNFEGGARRTTRVSLWWYTSQTKRMRGSDFSKSVKNLQFFAFKGYNFC